MFPKITRSRVFCWKHRALHKAPHIGVGRADVSPHEMEHEPNVVIRDGPEELVCLACGKTLRDPSQQRHELVCIPELPPRFKMRTLDPIRPSCFSPEDI